MDFGARQSPLLWILGCTPDRTVTGSRGPHWVSGQSGDLFSVFLLLLSFPTFFLFFLDGVECRRDPVPGETGQVVGGHDTAVMQYLIRARKAVKDLKTDAPRKKK